MINLQVKFEYGESLILYIVFTYNNTCCLTSFLLIFIYKNTCHDRSK